MLGAIRGFMTMRQSIANIIQWILQSIGIRSIDKQFLFSYCLIAAFTSVVAIHLFLSFRETLNNYLRCQDVVKNQLKMLIYYL